MLSATQDALFLRHHARQQIPVGMLLGGLATAAATIAINRFFGRRAPNVGLRLVLGGLGLATGALALWNIEPGPASTFGLFVFCELATTLGAAATWTYFQAPLEPSRLRTVLPRLGVYAGLGGLAGSLAIRAVLAFAPPQALLALATVAWLAAALLVRADPSTANRRAHRRRVQRAASPSYGACRWRGRWRSARRA